MFANPIHSPQIIPSHSDKAGIISSRLSGRTALQTQLAGTLSQQNILWETGSPFLSCVLLDQYNWLALWKLSKVLVKNLDSLFQREDELAVWSGALTWTAAILHNKLKRFAAWKPAKTYFTIWIIFNAAHPSHSWTKQQVVNEIQCEDRLWVDEGEITPCVMYKIILIKFMLSAFSLAVYA